MLCDIYGNAMLYFYYVIVTFFFHGGKMCRIFSIPWGGTIYGTIFHPVGWKMFRHIFHPGWTKVVLCRIFSIQWGGKCAGFFPSSGSDGECNGEIDGEKKIHPFVTRPVGDFRTVTMPVECEGDEYTVHRTRVL